MSDLLELSPLTVVSDSADLDELFFTDDETTWHPVQNCLPSNICESGSHTEHCVITQ